MMFEEENDLSIFRLKLILITAITIAAMMLVREHGVLFYLVGIALVLLLSFLAQIFLIPCRGKDPKKPPAGFAT